MTRQTRTICLLAPVCAMPPTAAAGATPPSDGGVRVVVKTVTPTGASPWGVIAGRLLRFSLEDGLWIEEQSASAHIDTENIVEISTHAVVAVPSSSMFELTMDVATQAGTAFRDRVIGAPGEFNDDRLLMDAPALGTFAVPIEFIATWRNLQKTDPRSDSPISTFDFRLSPAGAPSLSSRDNAASRSASPPRRMGWGTDAAEDALLLTNGDWLRGVITSLNYEGVVLEIGGDGATTTRSLDHDRVVAAVIVGVPIRWQAERLARVHLVDGSIFTTDRLSWAGEEATLRVFEDQTRTIATESIARIDIVGGRWRSLTSLAPVSAEHTPMMAVAWDYRVDRNVLGGRLHVAGQRFDRGFGVHSRSTMTFDLGGAYRQFVASYGIDDDSGSMADVTVRIRTDGQLRHERQSVKRGTLFGPVRIGVAGVQRLELTVDFGRFGGVQDRFNWIDPALIR